MEAPQSIEATGTTIEDAIARGLEALNVTRNEVDILILTAEPACALILFKQAGISTACAAGFRA